MKRWLLFVLLFGLLFVAVLPVSAAGNGRSNFTLVGKILQVDVNAVEIDFWRGNNLARSKVEGENVTVKIVDNYTRCFEIVGDLTKPIGCDELVAEDPVSVHGIYDGTNWTASRITVGAKLIHFP